MNKNIACFSLICNLSRRVVRLRPAFPIAALLFVMTGCHGSEGAHDEHDGHDHSQHADHSEGVDEHDADHDDEGLIILEPGHVENLEIGVETVSPGEFANIIKVSGAIVASPGAEGAVAARQAGIVKFASGISEGAAVAAGRTIATVTARGMSGGDPNEAARVAYQAAKRELDRLTPLHKEGIVATRDYNAALQRVEVCKVALSGGTANGGSAATASINGVITSIDVVDGQFVEAGQTIATISSNNALTLRADLPESEAVYLSEISNARFRTSYSDNVIDVVAIGGRILTHPTLSSASNGYIPVYFTLPNSGGNIINGAYCEIYLLANPRHGVLSVADKGVSEQQGEYFVYVEKSPGHYEKRPVVIGQTDGLRREILSGLQAGEKVVCKGVSFVRLAESSGSVPEGHSHSH